MTELETGSSGTDQKSSGLEDGANEQGASSSKDTVAYDTYQKVLREKKKRDEELEATRAKLVELEKEKKTRVETELKEKEDWKKLVEIREKEKQEIEQKFNSLNSDIQESAKFSAFLDALPGQLPKKFWSLVSTKDIVIDPSTGEPDPVSIKKAAESFQASFSELIVQQGKAKLPNQAASSSSTPITKEVWNSLSPKEKKERLPEYVELLKQGR